MNKNVEVIGMIYKSVDYLKLMINQMNSFTNKTDWKVSYRIVANDATPKVLDYLKTCGVAFTVYNDPTPNAYYLNRVYRAWNHGGFTSSFDNICFVNSDMIYSDQWLHNLLQKHNGVNIPTSRLVESGKLRSGQYGIEVNFGRKPSEINYAGWYTYSNQIKSNDIKNGGLYMPCVFETKRFIESKGFPEGNIYQDGIGTTNGHPTKSGDDYYFHDILEQKYGMKHVTVFNSLVYHMQEGEKDE